MHVFCQLTCNLRQSHFRPCCNCIHKVKFGACFCRCGTKQSVYSHKPKSWQLGYQTTWRLVSWATNCDDVTCWCLWQWRHEAALPQGKKVINQMFSIVGWDEREGGQHTCLDLTESRFVNSITICDEQTELQCITAHSDQHDCACPCETGKVEQFEEAVKQVTCNRIVVCQWAREQKIFLWIVFQ